MRSPSVIGTFLLAWSLPSFAAPGAGSLGVLFSEDFEAGIAAAWVERGFPSVARRNTFSLGVEASGNHYLKAESARSTSGRGVYIDFSPRRCRHLSWRWMISDTIARADIRRKEGDDASAKIYVVLDGPSGWNPFDKRILVYVWDNAAPVGSVIPNAWLPEKERMLVLESGPSKAGQWIPERVDLARDLARSFPGESIGRVEAIAFIADTDNTAGEVWAALDDLRIECDASAEDGGS